MRTTTRVASSALLLVLASLCPILAQTSVTLRPFVSGLQSSLLLTHAGDGSGRLFVLEQGGRIRIVKAGVLLPQPFLDISSRVESGGEKGLLGLAFHPNFQSNRRFFVNYTRRVSGQLQTVVAEYRASATDPDVADSTEQVILQFDQPFDNHNGGYLAFGPDGYLYIGTGDGGSGGDPQGNSQNLSSLLGKILRIDVTTTPYTIPPDNPFVTTSNARPEIWAYGLRNPWRFSFDRVTGRLFVGDVGQNSFEEVDLIQRGGDYGWNRMEGSHCYPPSASSCDSTGLIGPIAEYGRTEGSTVIGGYVYRGKSRDAPFWGAYVFGDFGSGTIWYLTEDQPGVWTRRELLRGVGNISSFGEDESGELCVVRLDGTIAEIRFPSVTILPHAADGTVPIGSLKTTVFLVNSGNTDSLAQVGFYDSDGNSRPVGISGMGDTPVQITVPARSSRSLVTTGTSQPIVSGWLEVKSQGPLSASLLYGIYSGDGLPVSEAGLGASSPGRDFVIDISRNLPAGLDVALAFVNASAEATADVQMTVVNRSGQSIGSQQFSLAPRHHRARFVGELITLPEDLEATVIVVSTVEIGVLVLRTLHGVLLSSLPAGN